jgi:uracil-DNA glycosylase
MLNQVIGDSWVPVIGEEFTKEYMQKLSSWLSTTRTAKTIYPDGPDVFRALKLCPHGQVKVVIIGQDPYYDGTADGLAFSYKEGIRPPGKKKSLDVILDEIERDCYDGFNVNRDYQLDYLAKQGVLLLNTVLTVFKGKPNSHRGFGWEFLTDKIIASQILERSPKVFMLWGVDAKTSFGRVIANLGYLYDEYYHLILEAKHPAADLYGADQFGDITPDYPNTFSGCKHFSQANDFLDKNNMTRINWFSTEEPYFNKELDLGYPANWNI